MWELLPKYLGKWDIKLTQNSRQCHNPTRTSLMSKQCKIFVLEFLHRLTTSDSVRSKTTCDAFFIHSFMFFFVSIEFFVFCFADGLAGT